MTLEEAIRIQEIEEAAGFQGISCDFEKAAKLGIEALKAIPHYRRIVYPDQRFLLLGETEE